MGPEEMTHAEMRAEMSRQEREVRAALDAAMLRRGPLCPADLDPEVWVVVASRYPRTLWTPAPEYHPEYRDARDAAEAATRRLTTRLTERLRELDRQQAETDESGGAEVAWYYHRDGIEDLLGLARGTLDTYDHGSDE